MAHGLIASFETANESDEAGYAELKAATKVSVEEIDHGEGLRVSTNELREFIRDLRCVATERVARESA